jgi:hypothetical protein
MSEVELDPGLEVGGCWIADDGSEVLSDHGAPGFRLESRGQLGTSYTTYFTLREGAEGAHARVEFAIKYGWLRTRDTGSLPPRRQLRALHELGYETVAYRDECTGRPGKPSTMLLGVRF